ncbi:MAG: isoprenylcysteine carboxylmethyltransferase family protein [Methylococcales bacterium]|nr:MAG: isoprenylcysteine carboxylmethyltransferase family protein [Methylococcales bacterium]
MNTLNKILSSRVMSFFSGLLLALLWSWFAYRHLNNFIETNSWSSLFFAIIETLAVCFYLLRSAPSSVSINPFDWLVAFIGTFMPLSLRPEQYGMLPFGEYLIFLGAFFQTLSIISLNRSFALVPAKRVIKTSYMYRIVRHPLYASYILGITGYVLRYTSEVNLTIYIITMISIGIRVIREESHLAKDSTYIEYMQKVRYRLIPFVF